MSSTESASPWSLAASTAAVPASGMSMMPLEAVQQAAAALEAAGIPAARSDAECLVAHVLGVARTDIHAAARLEVDEIQRLHAVLERRRLHEPLAYIFEESRFRRLLLKV